MNLPGTIWVSGSVEGIFEDSNYGGSALISQCDKITISFGNNGLAEIIFENLTLYDPILGIYYTELELFQHIAVSYTYDGKNISLKVWWDSVPNQYWTGKIENNKMTLANVFGKTVEFRKI